jgi:hypothetical protein
MGIRRKVVIGAGMAAARKAKQVFDDRGGTEGVKADLAKAKEAGNKPGSLGEKAGAVLAAFKQSGPSARSEDAAPPPPRDTSEHPHEHSASMVDEGGPVVDEPQVEPREGRAR